MSAHPGVVRLCPSVLPVGGADAGELACDGEDLPVGETSPLTHSSARSILVTAASRTSNRSNPALNRGDQTGCGGQHTGHPHRRKLSAKFRRTYRCRSPLAETHPVG